MEFIDFKSSKDIEKSRQDLREARDAMLEKAKAEAEYRIKRSEKARERGEGTWMLPEVSEKIDKSAKKSKHKKHKKEKKKKRKKEKRRKSSSESDSEVEDKIKPPADKISDHSDDKQCSNSARDEWMTLSGSLGTFTRSELHRDHEKLKDEKKDLDVYAPGKNSRELNPYWKDGGDGLPSNKLNFRKPTDDTTTNTDKFKYRQGNWRKKADLPNNENVKTRTQDLEHSDSTGSSSEEESVQPEQSEFLTDQQMNELAAKLVKAEILGNDSLVTELKQKLDDARNIRKNRAQVVKNTQSNTEFEEAIVLTRTDSRGLSRPLANPKSQSDDPYYGRKRKNKKIKVDTHTDGKRTKYFADDDRHSLKDMFEKERLSTTDDQNKEFADIVAKHTNPNDTLEDIFAEKIRSRPSDSKTDEKAKNRAVREHEKLSQALDECNRCLDSKKMEKHLIVAMGEYVYLSLLPTEGLGKGHCCIVPMRHVSCSTLLDEEIWREIQDFKKALTRMFNSRSLDVVFFENAIYLNKRPHMVIQCVPGPSRQMELVPFYFKKAIQECEGEWSHNKKLIELKGREVTKAIPKGLPYFWVDFGDNTGFAHVIEEQDRFPRYFAQEIIGGMLELEPRMWRHPKKQHLPIQKVTELAEWWKPFDITK